MLAQVICPAPAPSAQPKHRPAPVPSSFSSLIADQPIAPPQCQAEEPNRMPKLTRASAQPQYPKRRSAPVPRPTAQLKYHIQAPSPWAECTRALVPSSKALITEPAQSSAPVPNGSTHPMLKLNRSSVRPQCPILEPSSSAPPKPPKNPAPKCTSPSTQHQYPYCRSAHSPALVPRPSALSANEPPSSRTLSSDQH